MTGQMTRAWLLNHTVALSFTAKTSRGKEKSREGRVKVIRFTGQERQNRQRPESRSRDRSAKGTSVTWSKRNLKKSESKLLGHGYQMIRICSGTALILAAEGSNILYQTKLPQRLPSFNTFYLSNSVQMLQVPSTRECQLVRTRRQALSAVAPALWNIFPLELRMTHTPLFQSFPAMCLRLRS